MSDTSVLSTANTSNDVNSVEEKSPSTSLSVCLVDGEGQYHLCSDEITNLFEVVDPKNTQDYSIVGIMGCQSSGKSTFLNEVFGTDFQMMSTEFGRSQTTRGVWIAPAATSNNLIVMDLEGTDSGEKGEDRTTFERQTILYGISLCEVMIVNMWYTDIGRYTASNYGVMKTVFEVNLQLFKAQSKTTLLFVIRDFIPEQYDFKALEVKLRKDMDVIWAELRKPEEFANSSIEQFFDFSFEWLPHYVLQKDRFKERAVEIRERFSSLQHPQSILNTPSHGSKSVPAEAFAQYSESVWNVIHSNQDLNLPSQRELLATFRCDEVIGGILTDSKTFITKMHDASKVKYNPEIGVEAGRLISDCVSEYNKLTDKYVGIVVDKKRQELVNKLLSSIETIISDHIGTFVVDHLSATFKKDLAFIVRDDELSGDLYIPTSQLKLKTLNNFSDQINTICNGMVNTIDSGKPDADGNDWVVLDANGSESKGDFATVVYSRFYSTLESNIDQLIEAVRLSQLSLLTRMMNRDFYKLLSDDASVVYDNCSPDMWRELAQVFEQKMCILFEDYTDKLSKLANDDEEGDQVYASVVSSGEKTMKDLAVQHTHNVFMKMKTRFEAKFARKDGVRRVWGANDTVRLLFINAKDDALKILETFTTFQMRQYWSKQTLDMFTLANPNYYKNNINTDADSKTPVAIAGKIDVDATDVESIANSSASVVSNTVILASDELLSPTRIERIERDFSIEVEIQCQDAERERERNMSQSTLPPWAIVMMLVLGYNEILAIVTNPFFLVLAVLLGIAAFVVNSLGMWGPVSTAGRALVEQLLSQVSNILTAPTTNNAEQTTPNLRRTASTIIQSNPEKDGESELTHRR